MDEDHRQRFSAIAHGEMTILNPLSPATIDRCVEAVALPEGARVLDLGCGKAELLARVVERYGATAVGVERSRFLLDVARARVAGLPRGRAEIVEADARTYVADRPFDLVICVGPGWEHGDFGALVGDIGRHVTAGGLLLVADTYWRAEPSAEYLGLLGLRRESMTTHDLNTMRAVDLGMQPVWSGSASQQDWDRYEFGYFAAVDRWATAHPDDPDHDAFLSEARATRDRYLRGGRDYLGFGIYLFRVP